MVEVRWGMTVKIVSSVSDLSEKYLITFKQRHEDFDV